MRTRTIYAAQSEAALACEWDALSHRDGKPYQFTERRKRKERQWTVFERELLRRMDERDALVASRNMNKTRTFTDEGGRFMTITGKWGI